MTDDVKLSCFIEGTKRPFDIFIPHNSKGDALKEKIFNRRCKELAPDYDHLVLLKANVERHCPCLPLLRFNLGDEGITEISPRQMISEIWQVPPPSGLIHIFVTFTNLPSGFEGRRRLLEAAHIIYYTFWGKDLNKLLQLVPECGNFRYLTKEQIHKLGVRGPLGYREVVLLVRKEYEDAYSELRSYQSIPEESRGGGVVVLGQPGIGKTCFLYYLLFRLLSEEKTVAFQRGDIFVLFTETGVQICGSTGLDAAIIPHGTWALADSHTGFERPCEAFLDASGAGTAWVVQTASPSKSNYERWQKEQDARLFWMQVVPFDELNALGKILGLNAERLRKNYNLWGPSVRVCISLTKNPDDVGSYAQSVADAADSLTSQYDDFKSTSTRELFVVRPTSSSRQMVTEEFGTNHLRGIVARAYAKHDHATRLTFYKAIRRLSLFSSPAGQMYEINVLLWFRHARDTDFLRCTSNTTGSPQLEIPACPGNLKFFSQPNELHEMYEPGRPICWVPTSGTLPTLDAVVLTDDSVVTVQITVASKHSANNLAFEDVYRNLPPRLKDKPRCHVFISDSDYNAKSLRKQDLTIPEGTHVYSAIVDVEELDSEIVTEDRVEALEKERVSMSELSRH